MPTLHDVTDKTKLILKWGGITLGAFIVLLLVYQGGLFIKNTFFPPQAPPPTALFGKLPPIHFPVNTDGRKLTYTIDTVSGKLPVFVDEQKKPRDRINVYAITNKQLTLLDLQNTRNHVAKVGFGGLGIQISGNIYRFQNRDALPKTIDIDIVNKNFTISSSFSFNENILKAENLPSEELAVEETTRFLETLGVFPDDIDTNKTKIQILKLKNGILLDADSFDDAQIIRIDFFQSNKGSFPLYYPKGVYSTMYFLVATSSPSTPNIVLSNFYHQTIATNSATYKLKPVSVAFEELKSGKGHIAANFVQENVIKIKDVFLGYYAGNEYQEYLMPIYVFKSIEDEFYAYISAVDDAWIQAANPATTPASEQNR